jgi:D-apiose dehydrogenase
MAYRGVLIGCGFFARNHMNAWAGLEHVMIEGVCDTDRSKAEDFAQAFGTTAYTDAEAMLAKLKPDFTDIATTVASHRKLVELAAAHSKTVICQKPFAETLQDAAIMVEACDARRIPLLVHENFRWQLPYVMLRRAVEAGDIGKPKFLRLSFRHGFDVYANQPYLTEVEDLALTDVGLHLFDLSRFLMGDVERVSCETQKLNPRVKGQDAFQAILRHVDGAISSIECSFFSHITPDPFPQTLAWLEGDKGTLELQTGYQLRLHANGKVTSRDVEPQVPGWGSKPWHLVQDSVIAFESHVIEVLKRTASPEPSGADNLETLVLTLAAIQSAKASVTVHVDTFKQAELARMPI